MAKKRKKPIKKSKSKKVSKPQKKKPVKKKVVKRRLRTALAKAPRVITPAIEAPPAVAMEVTTPTEPMTADDLIEEPPSTETPL